MDETQKKLNVPLLVGGGIIVIVGIILAVLFFLMRDNQTPTTTIATNAANTNATVTNSSATNDQSAGASTVATPDVASSWVYATDALQLLVTSTDGGTTCGVEWLDSEPGVITLHSVNESGAELPLEATFTETTCVIAADVSTFSYIGISIDGEDVGGLEPPLVADATTGGLMHAMFVLPDNPTTVYPTSGIWDYNMTASTSNLNCSVGAFSKSASGQVTFVTTSQGLAATMNADSSSIYFTRQAYNNPYYVSPDYTFPIQGDYGSVRYSFNVTDQEHMSGTLHMEGDVCTGDYPLTMTLIAPTVPPIYVPHQGSWNIQYGPLACGGNVINTATMPGLPLGATMLSVTGGGPAPMLLSFSGSPSSVSFLQTVNTNIYASMPYLYLGTAIDPITNIPYSVMGTWNASVLSETQIMATLTVMGTNGCVGAAMVQMQQL